MTDPTTAELERIARQLCEASRGAGAWDKPRCHKNHWRQRALPMAQLAAEPLGIGKTLMRACGWQV
jgi:hypothetical protein